MRLRFNADRTAAILPMGACVLALFVVAAAARRDTSSPPPVRSAAASLSNGARSVLEQCQENVWMIHDVHWAAACSANAEEEMRKRSSAPSFDAPDDSPDCMLPMSRAATLNAARTAAEDMCMDEAAAADRLMVSAAGKR